MYWWLFALFTLLLAALQPTTGRVESSHQQAARFKEQDTRAVARGSFGQMHRPRLLVERIGMAGLGSCSVHCPAGHPEALHLSTALYCCEGRSHLQSTNTRSRNRRCILVLRPLDMSGGRDMRGKKHRTGLYRMS
ncbi:hypothetical protein BD289DRAFT_435241 [Coniella lustricola]|uniref:Secreted protein n=1 Tax=Coniella lustricola TaxID=2025994 RepID=A0A2T3A6I5_9PEZI|nr:hypothetical protein BD289DRAFT_435241 [Coniella lustricola]